MIGGTKMINKKILSNQKGFSIAEISVAILLLIIFVSLIVTIFNNVYLSFVNSKRNSVATMYATQIAEKIEAMLYEEVTSQNLEKSAYLHELNIPEAYQLRIEITPNTENTAKKIDIEISYIVGNTNNIKKVNIQKIKTRENEGIPNKPEVYSGMVPVKYDTSLNSWIIASAKKNNWYNYYNNQWANVMLLDGLTVDGGIKVIEDNKEELVGKKVISGGSMFVWIPRYAYKLDAEQNITDIEFLMGASNKYLDTTEKQELKDISEKEGYIISSAFENETEKLHLKGFWVSKYPAGYQESTITIDEFGQEELPALNQSGIMYSNLNYSSCNAEYTTNALGQNLSSTQYSNQRISYPVFKNLTYAYNLISVSDAKAISDRVSKTIEFYGLNSSKVNSHLTNNNEWDAVIFLASSKYGNYQIRHNSKNLDNLDGKNIYSVTGYSSSNIVNGVASSSTNNMSGVFDLNGCIWEHTFDSDNKYYIRGGDCTVEKGVSSLENSDGEPNINKGFRVILTAK